MQLPRWASHDHTEDTYGQLEPVLQDITYPHLYELGLSQCEVHTGYLIDLCMRHKSTLRRLSLCDILLLDDRSSFREILTRLSGQLPNLRTVELRGTFRSDLTPIGELISELEDKYLRTDPFRDALVNFLVKGGDYPDQGRVGSPQYGILDKSYVPPGLPDDDKKPDYPALDYDPDEFDRYLKVPVSVY